MELEEETKSDIEDEDEGEIRDQVHLDNAAFQPAEVSPDATGVRVNFESPSKANNIGEYLSSDIFSFVKRQLPCSGQMLL